MSKKVQYLLMAISIFVIGFLGIMAGNWFAGWRSAKANVEAMGEFHPVKEPEIKEGDNFPALSLLNYNYDIYNTEELFAGKKTVIMFLEPGCDPCYNAILDWSQYSDKLPDDFQIVGIASSEPRYAFSYIEDLNFPYLFFCDTAHKLIIEYGVNGFPGAMGINEKGVVTFGYRHIHNKFTPMDAYELLAKE